MKKVYTLLYIFLILLVLGLAVLSVNLYLMKDKKGPEIIFEQENAKYDGINEQLFLLDVSAMDEKDGDVTDSLRIKTVLETEDKYIVTYLAKDTSNNISERSRYVEKNR